MLTKIFTRKEVQRILLVLTTIKVICTEHALHLKIPLRNSAFESVTEIGILQRNLNNSQKNCLPFT